MTWLEVDGASWRSVHGLVRPISFRVQKELHIGNAQFSLA